MARQSNCEFYRVYNPTLFAHGTGKVKGITTSQATHLGMLRGTPVAELQCPPSLEVASWLGAGLVIADSLEQIGELKPALLGRPVGKHGPGVVQLLKSSLVPEKGGLLCLYIYIGNKEMMTPQSIQ